MTLFPTARAFLDNRPASAVAGSPGYDLAADRTASDVPPDRHPDDSVATVVDVDAAGVPARWYVPAGADRAVVALHGGGWVKGSVTASDPAWRLLAASSGLAVLSVDYRLAPEHPYPAPLEDVATATAWLRGAVSDFGIDPTALGIVGDSAGANLAAGAVLRDPGAYAAHVLVYPATDPVCATASHVEERHGLLTEAMQWYWQAYAGAAAADPPADLAPARASELAGLPPAYVITAEHDCLRDEGEQYATRLAEAGVSVVATRVLGMVHGFWGNPTTFPQSVATIDAVGAWLRRALHGR